MNEWQPIETAPDHTPVLVYAVYDMKHHPSEPQISVSWRFKNSFWSGGPAGISGWTPLYWMPLPEPPK